MAVCIQFNASTLKVAYNTATNKIILGNCTVSPCEQCTYYTGENECTACFDADKTPLYMIATVAGVFDCDTQQLSACNGVYCLTKDDTDGDCIWDGSGPRGVGGFQLAYIPAEPAAGWGSALRLLNTDLDEFYFNDEPVGECEISFTNDLALGDCGNNLYGALIKGYDGTITITDLCV